MGFWRSSFQPNSTPTHGATASGKGSATSSGRPGGETGGPSSPAFLFSPFSMPSVRQFEFALSTENSRFTPLSLSAGHAP